MLSEEELYIMNVDALHDDLYRMGKSSDANFSEARGLKDCLTYDRNGIKFVVANGNGFSAFTFIIPRMKDPKEKVWKIRKGTPLPQGIRPVKDLRHDHQGHYMLAHASDMPLAKYLGLLAELPSNPAYAVKLSPQEMTTCPTTPH
jgi:hypothetical protein